MGHAECLKLLLAHPQIEVNLQTEVKGHTALMCAKDAGNEECVKLLHKHTG